MNPSIKLDIDPHRIERLTREEAIRFGGVRVKTTIYIVQEPDIVGATTSTVSTYIAIPDAKVELRIVE